MRKELGDRPGAYILIGVALGFLLMFGLLLVSQYQSKHGGDIGSLETQTDSAASDQIDLKNLWRKTVNDPVAAYTGVLAALTLCLVVVSFFQGYMLIRSDRTARISADAAKRSAEIIPAIERPYIFAYGARAFEEYAPMTYEDQVPWVEYTVANHGKTPAIVTGLRAEFIVAAVGKHHVVDATGANEFLDAPIVAAEKVVKRRAEFDLAFEYQNTEDSIDNVVPTLNGGEDLFFRVLVTYDGAITKGLSTDARWRWDKVRWRFVTEHPE